MSSRSKTLGPLLLLAWPIVVARSSQAVIGFCDALMTAPLGEAELAAVTTGSMNVYALSILPMGLAFIVQSFAAQLQGQGELQAARRYAWYGLILAGAVGVFAAACIPFVGDTLGELAYAPAVHQHMTGYLEIRFLALAAIVGMEALGNWFGGLGNTRVHMQAGLAAMVVNVSLNWVLIGGNLGAPALGVEGAAIASVIASWVGVAWLVVAFALHLGVERAEPSRLRFDELLRMIRFGLPNGLNWFLEFAAFIVFINVIVVDLGTATLAAMMVVFNINSVSFMPSFGLASAGAIIAGQAIGRGHPEEVPHTVRTTALVGAIWQGTVGLFYVAIPATLIALFETSEGEEMLTIGATLLAISAAWQLFDAVAMAFSETLRAAGDTAWTMWARLLIAWFVFTPAAYLSVTVYGGGYVAAMLCIVGYIALLAIVFALRFRSGAWKQINLTG